ncbi:MAG TPA: hypothetical protein VGQ04_07805 [Chitinophagaceae bacterium]|nr:hypothetical protein [Chitinophagaceae bacterium]
MYPKIILLFCGLCIGGFAFAQGEAPRVFNGKAVELNAESLKNKFSARPLSCQRAQRMKEMIRADPGSKKKK